MRRLLRLTAIGALLCGLDAPAVLLQGYAWTAMTLRGLRRGSVSQALSDTFDGRHPCALCSRLRAAAPAQSLRSAPPPKPDLFPPLAAPAPAFAAVRVAPEPRLAAPDSRAAAPPVPPPDALA